MADTDYFDYTCTGCGVHFTMTVPASKGVEVNFRPSCPTCGHARRVKEGGPSSPPSPIRESLQMGDGVTQMRLF